MSELKYVIGDATRPEGDGNRIIAHVCNDQGGWGAGFVLALSAHDKMPEAMYREWAAGYYKVLPFALGKVQVCPFGDALDDLYVANMIAQRGYTEPGKPAISYAFLATCLQKLRFIASAMQPQASVHMPRIGCGLAGGEWSKVELLIQHFLTERGVPVTVYDLPVKWYSGFGRACGTQAARRLEKAHANKEIDPIAS